MAISYKFTTTSGAPAKPALNKFMKKVKQDIAQAEVLLLVKSEELARQAGYYMAQRVRAMTKRKGATGELADALENSVKVRMSSKSNFTITVGNKADLPEYWAMINYGGYVKTNNGRLYGFWSDNAEGKSDRAKKGGVGEGEFIFAPGGHIMTPRKPIKGFQYIAYAHVRMLKFIKTKFSILPKK